MDRRLPGGQGHIAGAPTVIPAAPSKDMKLGMAGWAFVIAYVYAALPSMPHTKPQTATLLINGRWPAISR